MNSSSLPSDSRSSCGLRKRPLKTAVPRTLPALASSSLYSQKSVNFVRCSIRARNPQEQIVSMSLKKRKSFKLCQVTSAGDNSLEIRSPAQVKDRFSTRS